MTEGKAVQASAVNSTQAGTDADLHKRRIKAKQDKEAGIAAQQAEKDKKSKKKK